MEKRAVIEEGITPPEETNEKKASERTLEQLEDHTTTRIIGKFAKKLKAEPKSDGC
jgi:trehalose-6-phosphate synthase